MFLKIYARVALSAAPAPLCICWQSPIAWRRSCL